MIIFPAVDIKGGKCVRLLQGRADREIIYESDPLKVALAWQERGAGWLHVVDLDGAFAGKAVNRALISEICRKLSVPVQVGGGIRDLETAQAYAEAGAARIIIGTMAVEHPEIYAEICTNLPDKVGVSLDTEGGRLKTRGWIDDSGMTIEEIMPRLYAQGTAFIVHTDISRDGMRGGLNFETLRELASSALMPVIASGGVAGLDDIRSFYELSKGTKLEGIICGRALYEGDLNFEAALAWISAQTD
ncbi:MAG: 1-(5-phosphoribosyl)-5-[(5-phosphoribosylamino)methylideneamino]imidazole-4-carboxamide isomerase [Desulfovibrio sp.]|nr:1-(5-phosphoribosyl)-5-[(5-phosphoribosylamino)methylideneamino]imidazole-4-carboxamide isomerase [Desulfovibrio sp.]